jgi:predicted DNA binding CopG/RHH family protein
MILNQTSTKKQQVIKDLNESQKPLDVIISFRLSSEDLNKVKDLANQTGTNVSKVMKTLIKQI